jgi:hypothetical protein
LIFEKKQIKNPSEVIYSACLFMRYWSGLYPDDTQEMIKEGVQTMLKTAIKILEQNRDGQVPRMLLPAGAERVPTPGGGEEQEWGAARPCGNYGVKETEADASGLLVFAVLFSCNSGAMCGSVL